MNNLVFGFKHVLTFPQAVPLVTAAHTWDPGNSHPRLLQIPTSAATRVWDLRCLDFRSTWLEWSPHLFNQTPVYMMP